MNDMRFTDKPDWVRLVDANPAFDLNADALLKAGAFPLAAVQDEVAHLESHNGGILRATFDPTPLIRAMEQSGFDCWSSQDCEGTVILRIWRPDRDAALTIAEPEDDSDGRFWLVGEDLHLDVRHLPPPMPMVAILQFLDSGAHEDDLVVHTPQFPVHLMPELEERAIHWTVLDDQPGETIIRLSKDPAS